MRRFKNKFKCNFLIYYIMGLYTPVKKTEITAVGIRHADHVALSIRKSWY
jgi:hypothetical protein